MTTSTKRPRSTSLSSSDASLSPTSRSSSPAAKYARIPKTDSELATLYSSLICTLPPTCSLPNRPTRLDSAQDVEDHYAKYHTHVCEYPKCRCVFPDTRFLELHILECHDPITALRKERGEKTFACFLGPPTCTRVFSTPKGRRLHLINCHKYPKQYFFGVVNKGIGGLLKKWGPAASLYRGDWKPRNESSQDGIKDDGGNEMDTIESLDSEVSPRERILPSETTSDSRIGSRHVLPTIPAFVENIPGSNSEANGSSKPSQEQTINSEMTTDLNDVSSRMASLSLVPNKVRFGRGGRKGGFAQPGHRHGRSLTRSLDIPE